MIDRSQPARLSKFQITGPDLMDILPFPEAPAKVSLVQLKTTMQTLHDKCESDHRAKSLMASIFTIYSM